MVSGLMSADDFVEISGTTEGPQEQIEKRYEPAVKRRFPENTTTSQVHRISASRAYRCELQINLVTYSTAAARLAQF